MRVNDPTKGYNGNDKIPVSGYQHSYNQDEIVEFTKCMQDPVYFAETYFNIMTADGDIQLLKLHEFQKEAIRGYMETRKMILNTSRQIGKTTVATAIILHYVLFSEAKQVFLLSNNAAGSREILERIKNAYEMLPRFLQLGVKEWNKGSVTFDNKSKIVAAASSSQAIRGKTASLLYIDECAFIRNWFEFSAAVLPALSSGKETKTIFTSTPNGLNHFYEYCKNAQEDMNSDKWNGYRYIEVPWYKVAGRTEQWKKDILATINNDVDKFRVEYECSFEGSSTTLITGSSLKALAAEEPIYTHEGLRQYEKPEKGQTYFATVDTGWGKGLDFSTVQIFRMDKDEKYYQVASYSTNTLIIPDFSLIVFDLCKLYNNCYVLIEMNNNGGELINLLWMDYGYENVVMTKSAGRKGKTVSFGGDKNAEHGLFMSQSVKHHGCSMLKIMIEEKRMILRDEKTIHEMKVFSKKNNSYAADEGHNDDHVMPLVLLAWMVTDNNFKIFTESNILLSIKDDANSFADVMPLLGFSDGVNENKQEIEFMAGDIWQVMNEDKDYFSF